MSRGTVVIRVKRKTKMALDIFQAKQTVATGQTLTIDEALWNAILKADPEAIKRANKLAKEQGLDDE